MKEALPSESPDTTPIDEAETARVAAAAALDRKALDLRVLDLRGVTLLADYFLICHGSNPRQTKAIAEAIEERLRARGVRALHTEGENRGQWILLDFGVVVAHVFQEETRRFYGLEKLWADAEDVTEEMVRTASAES